MKGAVYNNPVQFLRLGNIKLYSILFYALNGDENVTYNDLIFLRIIKGDDIGISVMIEVLLVYLQQVFIRTKNVGKLA